MLQFVQIMYFLAGDRAKHRWKLVKTVGQDPCIPTQSSCPLWCQNCLKAYRRSRSSWRSEFSLLRPTVWLWQVQTLEWSRGPWVIWRSVEWRSRPLFRVRSPWIWVTRHGVRTISSQSHVWPYGRSYVPWITRSKHVSGHDPAARSRSQPEPL